jgi:hypothetical protein
LKRWGTLLLVHVCRGGSWTTKCDQGGRKAKARSSYTSPWKGESVKQIKLLRMSERASELTRGKTKKCQIPASSCPPIQVHHQWLVKSFVQACVSCLDRLFSWWLARGRSIMLSMQSERACIDTT